jgi:hypothetical protein
MTGLLYSLLAILAIGIVYAAIITSCGIDPESLQAWAVWLVAAAVAIGISFKLVVREEPASR